MELKQKEINYFLNILDDFFSVCNQNGGFLSFRDGDFDYAYELFSNKNYLVYHGCSRVCIIPKAKTRYILKIDIANGKRNYCEREYENYQEAVARGLKDLFAEIEFFSPALSFPAKVYLQEKVTNTEYKMSGDYSNSGKLTQEEWDSCIDCNTSDRMINEMLENYPLEKVSGLVQLIIDCGINDIHGGNYGYKNGKPVIFDYAGF